MKGRVNTAVRIRFEGWPKPALQFFHGLKRDNSKAYFEAHRSVYEEQVRQPMEALLAEVEQDLGPDIEVKIFRLNRDLRFSPDKRPYKEHLGAYLSGARASGVYLQVSDDGLYVAIGSHEMAPDQLTRFRDAVAGKDESSRGGLEGGPSGRYPVHPVERDLADKLRLFERAVGLQVEDDAAANLRVGHEGHQEGGVEGSVRGDLERMRNGEPQRP